MSVMVPIKAYEYKPKKKGLKRYDAPKRCFLNVEIVTAVIQHFDNENFFVVVGADLSILTDKEGAGSVLHACGMRTHDEPTPSYIA